MGSSSRHFIFLAFLIASLISAISWADEERPPLYLDDQKNEPLLALSHYKPIYFIMGRPDTKIELSFKVQIVQDLPIYFGYTQLMRWELFIHSPYDPLVFYRLELKNGYGRWIDLIPLEHESNGKGGADERSWNRVGASYHFGGLNPGSDANPSQTFFSGDFKAWVPFIYNPNNTNLAQYRGIWELDLSLTNLAPHLFDFSDLTLRLYPGGSSCINPFLGGQELTYRAKLAGRKFLPLFVAQIFHGFAESLLDYNTSHWGVRAGIGF